MPYLLVMKAGCPIFGNLLAFRKKFHPSSAFVVGSGGVSVEEFCFCLRGEYSYSVCQPMVACRLVPVCRSYRLSEKLSSQNIFLAGGVYFKLSSINPAFCKNPVESSEFAGDCLCNIAEL